MTETENQTFRILRFGGSIEEEIVLESDGQQVVCFAGSLPANLKEGDECRAVLTLFVIDEYDVTPLTNDSVQALERVGEGFRYKIVGVLSGGCIQSCGLKLMDDALETEYAYLNGKTVAMSVDRINARIVR